MNSVEKLQAELDAQVEYHDRCRDRIDAALGQPRDLVDGDIWEEFERAIKVLRVIARDKRG